MFITNTAVETERPLVDRLGQKSACCKADATRTILNCLRAIRSRMEWFRMSMCLE